MIQNYFTIDNGIEKRKVHNQMYETLGFIRDKKPFSNYICVMGENIKLILPATTIESNFSVGKGKIMLSKSISIDNVKQGTTFTSVGFCTTEGELADRVEFSPIVKHEGKSIVICGTLVLEFTSSGFLVGEDNELAKVLLGEKVLSNNIKIGIGNNYYIGGASSKYENYLSLKEGLVTFDNGIHIKSSTSIQPYEIILLIDDKQVFRQVLGDNNPYVKDSVKVVNSKGGFSTSDNCLEVVDVRANGKNVNFNVFDKVKHICKTDFSLNIGNNKIVVSKYFFALVGENIKVFSCRNTIMPIFSIHNEWESVDITDNGSIVCGGDNLVIFSHMPSGEYIKKEFSLGEKIFEIKGINVSNKFYIMAKLKNKIVRLLVNDGVEILSSHIGQFIFTKYKNAFVFTGDKSEAYVFNGFSPSLSESVSVLQGKQVLALCGDKAILRENNQFYLLDYILGQGKIVGDDAKILGSFFYDSNAIFNVDGEGCREVEKNILSLSDGGESDAYLFIVCQGKLYAYVKSINSFYVICEQVKEGNVICQEVLRQDYCKGGTIDFELYIN